MRTKGINPAIIRLMLGWSDEDIQNNYTHFDVAKMVKHGEIIDAVFTEQNALQLVQN